MIQKGDLFKPMTFDELEKLYFAEAAKRARIPVEVNTQAQASTDASTDITLD